MPTQAKGASTLGLLERLTDTHANLFRDYKDSSSQGCAPNHSRWSAAQTRSEEWVRPSLPTQIWGCPINCRCKTLKDYAFLVFSQVLLGECELLKTEKEAKNSGASVRLESEVFYAWMSDTQGLNALFFSPRHSGEKKAIVTDGGVITRGNGLRREISCWWHAALEREKSPIIPCGKLGQHENKMWW